MEWSRPTLQGDVPSPRAGHTGVTVGENWFIVGGGDNKSGKRFFWLSALDQILVEGLCTNMSYQISPWIICLTFPIAFCIIAYSFVLTIVATEHCK